MMMPRLRFKMPALVRTGFRMGCIAMQQYQVSMTVMLDSFNLMPALDQSRRCQRGQTRHIAQTAKPADEIIGAFCALREAHYRSLNTFDTFGKGWMRRLASIKAESTDMA